MTQAASGGIPAAARIRSIFLLVVCQTAVVSVWFAGSAAMSSAVAAGAFPIRQAGLLSSAVQLGFVAGTLAIALTGAADRIDPRRVFAASALACAVSTAALVVTGLEGVGAVLLRAMSGFALAGVYPVGMKLMAGWSRSALGLPMGLLVGALTLGSAMPNLFLLADARNWMTPIAISAASALAGAILIGFVALGPHHAPSSSSFRLADALRELRRPEVGKVTRGYLGHMWELYAMWAWIGAFLHWASPAGVASTAASLFAFTTIACGALGCIASGWLADRVGKQRVIVASLLISGSCAATIGVWADTGWPAVLFVAHIWGIAVIADSGNFSALTSERVDRRYVGTVLTLQVSAGFLLTFVAIQLMPYVIDLFGWRYAFAVLAIGPAYSIASLKIGRRPTR